MNSENGYSWKLKNADYRNAVQPLYDPQGGKKSVDADKNPTPLNCLDNNLILTYDKERSNVNSCTANRDRLVAFNKVTFDDVVTGQGLLDTHLTNVSITHLIYLDEQQVAKHVK